MEEKKLPPARHTLKVSAEGKPAGEELAHKLQELKKRYTFTHLTFILSCDEEKWRQENENIIKQEITVPYTFEKAPTNVTYIVMVDKNCTTEKLRATLDLIAQNTKAYGEILFIANSKWYQENLPTIQEKLGPTTVRHTRKEPT